MEKKVTYEMIAKVEEMVRNVPRSELPSIHREINEGMKWPKEFGDAKERPSIPEVNLILNEIECQVGFKSTWRYRKMECEGYSEQEFEDWWESQFIYKPLHKLYEFFGDCEGSYKSSYRDNYIKHLPSFLCGILFAVLLFLFI